MGRIFRGEKKKRKISGRKYLGCSAHPVCSGYTINYRLRTAQRYSEYPLGKAFQQTDTEILEEIAVNR